MLVYFPYRHAIETAHFTKSDEEPGCCGELCLGRIGIVPDTTIVVYGRPVQYGTYALWVLTMAGHQDVRLLDGGSCGKMGLRCWRVFAQDCDRPFHRVHSLLTRETMRHSRLLSNR
jgi:hypothetical protein